MVISASPQARHENGWSALEDDFRTFLLIRRWLPVGFSAGCETWSARGSVGAWGEPVICRVLDTSVVVAAMRRPTGASATLLMRARKGKLTLLANVVVGLEYEATCQRAEHILTAGITVDK